MLSRSDSKRSSSALQNWTATWPARPRRTCAAGPAPAMSPSRPAAARGGWQLHTGGRWRTADRPARSADEATSTLPLGAGGQGRSTRGRSCNPRAETGWRPAGRRGRPRDPVQGRGLRAGGRCQGRPCRGVLPSPWVRRLRHQRQTADRVAQALCARSGIAKVTSLLLGEGNAQEKFELWGHRFRCGAIAFAFSGYVPFGFAVVNAYYAVVWPFEP